MQGDWGEFILESLLEASGLRKGHEYLAQETLKQEDGRGARLDVVVKLPGGRHLVIDSKVSLGDYTDYCSSEEGAGPRRSPRTPSSIRSRPSQVALRAQLPDALRASIPGFCGDVRAD